MARYIKDSIPGAGEKAVQMLSEKAGIKKPALLNAGLLFTLIILIKINKLKQFKHYF
jgi:hypothetical protein